MREFIEELEELINKHSLENGSNTPDFILAEYLCKCLSAFNDTIQRREDWYGKDDLQTKQEGVVKEKKPREITRKELRDSFEYNALCARATLFPGKSLEEINLVFLDRRIDEAYRIINENISMKFNDITCRNYVIEKLKKELENDDVIIKCDEENNSPEAIDNNVLLAHITHKLPNGFHYERELIFGSEHNILQYRANQII